MSRTDIPEMRIEPPCIRNKCLKYPVCKQRSLINCGELKSYYHTCFGLLYDDYNRMSNAYYRKGIKKNTKHIKDMFNTTKYDLWTYINSFLPQATRITSYGQEGEEINDSAFRSTLHQR